MLPLWHQEVLIMMLGGMERVPSDISNDLNSCSGEQVHIYRYIHTFVRAHTHTHRGGQVHTDTIILYK